MKNKLTNKKYWDEHFGERKAFFNYEKSNYSKYLHKHIDIDPNKSCIEIGAYPGENLGYIAKHFQYAPTAIDFIDNIFFIDENMKRNGINNCRIIQTDIFQLELTEKYDIVMSHGFIEHFDNYEDVIRIHIELLKKNGILLITVPYLGGFQGWIRETLYSKAHKDKIWKSHNQKIMNLEELRRIIVHEHEMTPLFGSFIRNMDIWFPANKETIRMERLWIYKIFRRLAEVIKMTGISNRFISPEILIIAKRQ
jgi:SAM-dependent methyltransferase